MRKSRGPFIFRILLLLTVALSSRAWADEAKPPAEDGKGVWTEIKLEHASWAWGRRGAIGMDRLSGDLFLASWRPPGLRMSSDFGKTFTRAGGENIDGSPFSVYAILAAADGGKIAMFSSQKNAKAGHSLDGGKTWTTWAIGPSHGFDYGVVDWASGAIFAMPHEEYKAYYSPDMGKTWTKLDLNYPGGTNKFHEIAGLKYYQSGIGIFGPNELVYSHDSKTGIQRSEDAGKTWTKVADYFCEGPVQIYGGMGYWLAKKQVDGKWQGILLSTWDKGKTWQPVGKPIDNGESSYMTVPRFGKNEHQILIAAAAGILESTDDGNTWRVAVKYSEAQAANLWSPSVDTMDGFEYDPMHDAFYMLFITDHGDGVIHVPPIWVYRR